MLDISHIPNQSDNIKIFYTQGITTWQTWQKPRNCNFIWIMCIGAGAGGNGGGTTAGGTGGGSGGVCRVLYPANVLPDTLFIQPGIGSIGGAGQSTSSGTAAAVANRSFVTIAAGSNVAMNTVCVSGAAGAGTTNNYAAETIASIAQAGLMSLGTFQAIAGQAGDSTLVGITPLVATITCGGAAGFDGGIGRSVNSVNLGTYTTPQIRGGGGADFGGSGDSGIWSWKPMFGLGGAGGSNSQTSVPPGTGTGGNGGNGAYGCGGGGGGRGSIIGGNGGNGGDGLVIIATF